MARVVTAGEDCHEPAFHVQHCGEPPDMIPPCAVQSGINGRVPGQQVFINRGQPLPPLRSVRAASEASPAGPATHPRPVPQRILGRLPDLSQGIPHLVTSEQLRFITTETRRRAAVNSRGRIRQHDVLGLGDGVPRAEDHGSWCSSAGAPDRRPKSDRSAVRPGNPRGPGPPWQLVATCIRDGRPR
jgi:hypothetical protein